jgi:hypothetical protein
MSEMKPCPFCGSKALTNIFLDYEDIENLPTNVIDDYEPEVTCENERCIYGWWLSPKDWNTRPIEDALQARIAELKGFIGQLIEAGDAMSNAHSMWVAEEDKWDALVKDWKERER